MHVNNRKKHILLTQYICQNETNSEICAQPSDKYYFIIINKQHF